MSSNEVRFGVIGLGGMGSGHCRMLQDIPESRLAAVCDTNPITLEKLSQQYSVPAYSTHQELFESGTVDAVIIATPHYFHGPIAEDAFANGIHVLSEKPLSVTVAAADGMIAAAKKSGLKFGVMYQMRSEPRSRAAHRIVSSGALGEIYRTSLVMGWYRSQAYYNSGGWRATWAGEGGGVLINQAPHYLDLFSWLGGLPTSLKGETRTRLHDIEVEDEAFATLEYANGAHGYLYASTTEAPEHNQIEICGDRGKIVMHGHSLRHFTIDGSIREITETTTEMWGSPRAVEQDTQMPGEEAIRGHSAITANFARAILHGEKLMAPGEDGLPAVELINAIILSGHTGERVTLPVDRFAYNELITHLKQTSRVKAVVSEQLLTDPKFA